jgi:hypothetical protein
MSSETMQPQEVMEVPERLLKPSFEVDNIHPLLKTSKDHLSLDEYDKVGANGVFSVEP